MPPRRLARRAGYRPVRRRTTRRPRRRKLGLTSAPVLLTAGVLVSIGSPAIGIPILVLIVAGLWFLRPGQARLVIRAPRRLARIPKPRAMSISGYQAMTPGQFEHALADLCRRDGCTNVRVVGGAGDLAADVLATTPDGRRILIQAKRFGPKTVVRSGDVQKVAGTYRDIHHAQLAAIVTTNRFTRDAESVAHRLKIRAYDQHKLASWASRTGPAPWQ